MTYYAGPQEGDESPQGGGKHNAGNLGHEAFNFCDFDGRLYGVFGIVLPHGSRAHVDLQRVDPAMPNDAESIEGVLVVFVAPYDDGQRIVGWYRDAKVYRTSIPYPPGTKESIRERLATRGITNDTFGEYWFEADSANAVLLPEKTRMRMSTVPRGRGGMGQSPVCYSLEADGAPKNAPWIREAFELVKGYNGQNLLREWEASVEDEILNVQERAAGFQSNSEIRRLVEEHAMEEAKRELIRLGFDKFIRTAESECYDYTCSRDGLRYFVEVKGTQGNGKSVILTKNEVKNVKDNPGRSILIVVRSIRVRPRGESFDVSGGTTSAHVPWALDTDDLKAICFNWAVPSARAASKS
jgi:hypothetical protein